MLGRMMASALALTGVAYAQEATPPGVDAAGCTPLPACAAVSASSAPASGRVAYDAAFFRQFNPQTALDMVRQTPGFALDGGEDRRGFSGAVGNLLIDGLRPSSKSQSLEGILSRIPADQVVRVEVLRGAEVAGDASGQATLLNVVRTPSAGGGVWEAGAELTSRGVPAPRAEISYSGRDGNIEYGVGASIFSHYRDLPGWRELSDAAGNVTGRVDTPSPRDYREATLNGNLAFPLAGGRLSATSQVNWWRFHADSDYLFDYVSNPDVSFLTVYEESRRSYEIGLDYDRDFGPWALELIGLVNRARYESAEDGEVIGGAIDAYVQEVEQESGETILRGSLSRSLTPRHRIEFGAEGAFNTLDQALLFAEDGAAIPIPNSNVLIEEERAELFATHTWRPADAWSVETRVAWETSTLTFTGDANSVVELSFWKPSIQLTRSFGANNQLRFRVYRDVGQLDFGDFVSAAAVADGLISGGNPELVPQTDWRAELGADLRFPGGAALSLTLTRHEIRDVADLVKITVPNPPDPDIVFDAPGNVGDGTATSLDVNFSSPVPFVPGGRITVEGYLWDTEVPDPITGAPRIFSYQSESQIEVQFRQDLPRYRAAWGVNVFKQGEFQAYRFNEVDTNEEGPWVDVFVETTALPNNMRLRLQADDVLGGTINRDRRFFTPDRAGSFDRRDLRERQFASARFIVELSGRF